MGTILTALALLGIMTAIIVKIVRDKRKGKCADCSHGCGDERSSCYSCINPNKMP